MTSQNQENQQPSALYGDVKATGAGNLKSSIEDVDGITEEAAESLDRGGNQALRAVKRKIKRWSWWTLYSLGTIVAVSVTLAIISLGAFYTISIVESETAGSVVSSALKFLFGVAATLAAKSLFPGQRD